MMVDRIGEMRESLWESGRRKKESDMIAKMTHTAVRAIRSPSIVIATMAQEW